MDRLRIDKWLWAARFYKTRSLAVEAINRGWVLVQGKTVKPAHELKAADSVRVAQGTAQKALLQKTVVVLALSDRRGGAPDAALLYQETEASMAARLLEAQNRKFAPEPALSQLAGRPTKRLRRETDQVKRSAGEWNARWSASLDS